MPETDRAQRERILHDLACPLTVIRAACLDLGRGEDDPDRLRALAAIDAQTERLREGLAALRDPGASGALHPLSVADLVADAIDRLAPLGRAQGTRLTGSMGPDGRVRGDAHRLSRALDNLVVNALRHCRRRVVVSTSGRRRGERIAILVGDDGPGVAPADRERVFRAGWRGAPGRVEGRGLGLAIASDVAREHGGELRLLSSREGALFALDLPTIADDRLAQGAA